MRLLVEKVKVSNLLTFYAVIYYFYYCRHMHSCIPHENVMSGLGFFFGHGAIYFTSGLMSVDGSHLCQRGKEILAQELSGLVEGL